MIRGGAFLRTWVPALLLAGLIMAAAVRAIRSPFYNFDVVGYVASAGYLEGHRGDELLAHARADIEAGVRDERMRHWLLVGTSEYGTRVITEARCLEQQLGYYRPRILYVAGIVALRALGVGVVDATVWLSAVPWACVAFVVWWFTRRRIGAWAATLLVVLLSLGLNWADHARISSPDGLSTLFGVAGSLVLLGTRLGPRELAWGSTLLALSVLSRHDSIVHAGLFVPVAVWLGSRHESVAARFRRIALVAAPSAACYLWIASFAQWPGWNVVLVCGLISAPLYPLDLRPEFPAMAYWKSVRETFQVIGQAPFRFRETWPVYAALAAWRWTNGPVRVVLLACVVEVAVRFALFPRFGPGWHRLHMTAIVVALVLSATSIGERLVVAYQGRTRASGC